LVIDFLKVNLNAKETLPQVLITRLPVESTPESGRGVDVANSQDDPDYFKEEEHSSDDSDSEWNDDEDEDLSSMEMGDSSDQDHDVVDPLDLQG